MTIKINVKKSDLYQALNFVIGVIKKKDVEDFMTRVLGVYSNNNLKLIATNDVITKEYTIPATGEEEISWTFEGKKVLNFCRMQKCDDVVIKINNEQRRSYFYFNKAYTSLINSYTNDFLCYINGEREEKTIANITLTSDKILYGIKHTDYAIGNDNYRQFLNGMLLKIDKQNLTFTASDGCRISSCTIYISNDNICDSFIIPKETVNEIKKIPSNATISISFSNKSIFIKNERFYIKSQLVSESFPDLKNIIPVTGKIAKFSLKSFQQKLSFAKVIARETMDSVIQIHLSQNKMCFITKNADNEKIEDEMPVEYNDDDMTIAFNVNYLLDVCKALDKTQDVLYMMFTQDDQPVKFYLDDKQQFHIVMPYRL